MKSDSPRQHPLTFQHPALLALPKKERKRLVNRSLGIVMKQFGIARYLAIFIALNIVMQISVRFVIAPLKLHPRVTNLIVAVVSAGVPSIILLRTIRTRIVRRALEDLGGYCLQCGYDIRATPNICPECGAPIPLPAENSAS